MDTSISRVSPGVLSANIADPLSPLYYSMDATGKTNCATAFASLFSYASGLTGAVIRMPPGVYLIGSNNTVSLPSNTRIEGSADILLEPSPTTERAGFLANNITNWSVSGLRFISSNWFTRTGVNGLGSNRRGIDVRGSLDGRIENVQFIALNYGMLADTTLSSNLVLRNISTLNCHNGFKFSKVIDLWLEGIHCVLPAAADTDTGSAGVFFYDSVNDLTWIGGDISGGAGNALLSYYSAADSQVSANWQISGLRFRDVVQAMFFGSGASGVQLSDVKVNTATSGVLKTYLNSQDIILTDCDITNTTDNITPFSLTGTNVNGQVTLSLIHI